MRTIHFALWQRTDERLPYDFDFTDKLIADDTLASWQVRAYNIAVDAKTDLSGTIIDATGLVGRAIRVVVHSLTVGLVYHIEVHGESTNGQTYYKAALLTCGRDKTQSGILPHGGRESYLLNYEKNVPAGLEIDHDVCTFTAYKEDDLSTNIINGIKAGHETDGALMDLRIENGEKGVTYLVHALAHFETDPVTDSVYIAAKTLRLQCREI